MLKLSIRKIGIEDAAMLTSLSVTTFIDAFGMVNTKEDMDKYITDCMTVPILSAEIIDPANLLFFAESDGQAVGYIKIRPGTNPPELTGKKALEIERLYVLKDFQNQKIGNILIQHCISYALANDYDTIWLGVWEHNHNAIRFYQRLGFSLFGSHDFVLGNDLQTDVLMAKGLLSEY